MSDRWKLIMARPAIEQFGVLDRVIFGLGLVTIDAPAHVDGLFQRGDRLFAHIAMTVFAVQPGGDVRAVVEMDKIRHLINGNPINRLVFLHKCVEFLKFGRPLRNWNRRIEVFL